MNYNVWDYPNIDGETCRSLLEVRGDVLVPTLKGRKGHPILIDSRFANEIIWNFKYQSLRDFVLEKGFQGVEVGDYGILQDIDTMQDYEVLLKGISNK